MVGKAGGFIAVGLPAFFYLLLLMKNTAENIKLLFSNIGEKNNRMSQGGQNFVSSLQKYFKRKKILSDKQFDCLHEIGKNLIEN